MAISPFMAFAKGAFEGYNEIQREERAKTSAMDLERYKKNIAPDTTRYFQAMGSHGPVNLFSLSDAGDYTEEELFRNDMAMIGENLTKNNRYYTDQYGAIRAIDEDPVLSANVDKRVQGYMRKWMDDNTKEIGGENNKMTQLPYSDQNAYFYNHDYYGNTWEQIVNTGMVETLDMKNQPPNSVAVLNVDKDSNINASTVIYNNQTIGKMYDPETQTIINMDQNVFNNKLVPKLNSIKGNRSSAGDITVQYGTNAIRFHTQPVIIADLNDNEYLQQRFAGVLKPNEPITHGLIMSTFVKNRVVDPRMVDIFNRSVTGYNEVAIDSQKLSLTDIYKAFKLAAPVKMEQHSQAGRTVYTDSKSFINNTFNIDLEKLALRADAGESVVRTVGYIKDNIKTFEDENGYFPPIMQVLSGPIQFFAGLAGEAGLVAQSKSFFDSVGDKFELKKDAKILGKLEKYAGEAEAESNDSPLISAASTTARHRYFKYMLAYQLAVAIQGGTGGRTVSDQDVENMLEAIGDTLFANGRVQLSVLDTIGSFAQDIVTKNQFWKDSGMSVDAAYAADAMDRFMYGGVSVGKKVGTERTQYAGKMLAGKLSQISPNELEEEMSGLRDPVLNTLLIEKGIITEGERVSYSRGTDFNKNLTDHIKVDDRLSKEEYEMLVDRHYTGTVDTNVLQSYKTTEAYRNYLISHDQYNKRD